MGLTNIQIQKYKYWNIKIQIDRYKYISCEFGVAGFSVSKEENKYILGVRMGDSHRIFIKTRFLAAEGRLKPSFHKNVNIIHSKDKYIWIILPAGILLSLQYTSISSKHQSNHSQLPEITNETTKLKWSFLSTLYFSLNERRPNSYWFAALAAYFCDKFQDLIHTHYGISPWTELLRWAWCEGRTC